MIEGLLLLQEVDDLVAVLALVLAANDVDPVDVAVDERSNSENLKCGEKVNPSLLYRNSRLDFSSL